MLWLCGIFSAPIGVARGWHGEYKPWAESRCFTKRAAGRRLHGPARRRRGGAGGGGSRDRGRNAGAAQTARRSVDGGARRGGAATVPGVARGSTTGKPSLRG